MHRVLMTATVATVLLGVPALVCAQAEHSMTATSAASLEWSPIQPPGFKAGMEIAVVQGDPAAANEPYTVRLRFPDGYRFPSHYHPKAENVTVLSGTFLLSMGKTENEELTAYSAGDYLHIPPTQPHFGGARGATMIQLHSEGPFEILLSNPEAAKPGK